MVRGSLWVTLVDVLGRLARFRCTLLITIAAGWLFIYLVRSSLLFSYILFGGAFCTITGPSMPS